MVILVVHSFQVEFISAHNHTAHETAGEWGGVEGPAAAAVSKQLNFINEKIR